MESILEPSVGDTAPGAANQAIRFPTLQLSESCAPDGLRLPMPHSVSRYAARWPFSRQAWDGPSCDVSRYPSCVADNRAFPTSWSRCAQGTSDQAIQPSVLTTIFPPAGLARLGVGIIDSYLGQNHMPFYRIRCLDGKGSGSDIGEPFHLLLLASQP